MRIRLATLLILICNLPFARSQTYRSVHVDTQGRLSITLPSGNEIHPPMQADQAAFEDARLAPDHRTIGWLVDYPDPGSPAGVLAGALTLFRSGHLLRSFPTDQIVYSWNFQQHGKHVAFCTGPTHGGAAQCELHEVNSGRTLATWQPHAGGPIPAWATGLKL